MDDLTETARGLSRRQFVRLLAATSLGGAAPVHAQALLADPPPSWPDLDAAVRARPVAFLDRIGWGASAAQLQEMGRLGPSAYLRAQLQPQAQALPQPIDALLAALPANRPLPVLVPPIVQQERAIRQARQASDAAQTEAQLKALNRFKAALAQQAAAQQVLLALYSSDVLRQRLVWFWCNHFNVFRAGNIAPMLADYAQRVIAPHALGRFAELLRATMFSPQMLLYLNNAQNARGHVNENYARELMELHTLGVGGGYTQGDVTNLARVLTGLGVDLLGEPVRVRPALRAALWQRGLVVFNPARHDAEPKVVLGRTLRGQGLEEIDEVIALLADHPSTARHVCSKLAQYFVADPPAATLVQAMVWRWQQNGGHIAAVLETMFTHPEFVSSLARPQFKDPMRYVLSALRASLDEGPISNPLPVLGMINRLGEPLFGRQTPDGYPLGAAAWDSPGQLSTRFEVARQIAAGAPMLYAATPAVLMQAAPAQTPDVLAVPTPVQSPHRPPPDLAQSAVFLAQRDQLGAATRRALAQAINRVQWNALWLSSPEFMQT
ncbi:MAG: DUF1800 domain-containing protein [Thiomonas sp.]